MHRSANNADNWRWSVVKVIPYLFRHLCFLSLLSAVPLLPAGLQAAQVSLQWDASTNPAIAGYHLYCRAVGQAYNYASPAWQGRESKCTLDGLAEETTYYFVVRAFDGGGHESGDSNEVSFRSAAQQTSVPPQVQNPFPSINPSKIIPAPPSENGTVVPPQTPDLISPGGGVDAVAGEPELITSPFSGAAAGDSHAYTRWLIFRDSDNLCVYDQISAANLTNMMVPPLVLDGDTHYYWTALHYARTGAVSQPGQNSGFLTAQGVEDADENGVPDSHEVLASTDLDRNGISDRLQQDMKRLLAAYGSQKIGVKLTTGWPEDRIVTVRPVDPMAVETPGGRLPDMPDGLIGFKLQLGPASESAIVSIYFSDPVHNGVYWVLYDPVQGYVDYGDNASISADGRTVTLYLEDGLPGDMDGVANGVIVTMAGYSYAGKATATAGLSGSAAGSSTSGEPQWDLGVSCFIDSLK